MIGARLKLAREKAKHTQASLAEVMGTNPRQVWRWEAGENEPSGEIVARLAQALDVSSDYLLGLSDEPVSMVRDASKLNAKERAALSAWRRGDRFEAIKVIVDDDEPR